MELPNWPSLSNTSGVLQLWVDSTHIDSVSYLSTWGIKDGVAAERQYSIWCQPSHRNWKASLETPGGNPGSYAPQNFAEPLIDFQLMSRNRCRILSSTEVMANEIQLTIDNIPQVF